MTRRVRWVLGWAVGQTLGWLGVAFAANVAPYAWFQAATTPTVRLAPNGQWVGAAVAAPGRSGWWSQDLSTNQPGRITPWQGGGGVMEFAWTAESVAVLRGRNGSGVTQWWRTGSNLGELKSLPAAGDMLGAAQILPLQPHLAGSVLVQTSPRAGNRWWNLAALPVQGGLATLVAQNPGDLVQWLVDGQGRVRAGLGIRGRTQELRVPPRIPGGGWVTALTFDFVKDPARLLGCSTDGSRAWFAARMGSNTRGIYELDLSGMRVTKAVWSDPDFDFDGELLVNQNEPAAANFQGELPSTAWLSSPWSASAANLKHAAPAGFSTSGDQALFAVTSDQVPLRWQWFDRSAGEPRDLLPTGPYQGPQGVATEPVHWTSNDGTVIRGYLTRPGTSRNGMAPLVVWVHGGPWTRDTWGWQPEVQFLASRGWAVLQVNYRGSTGFGWAFQSQGAGQWPAAADDLISGARWAADRGIADPQRMVVAGASFGGFLAAQALARPNQPFRGAASLGGVFDLRLWLDESSRREPDFIAAAQRAWLLGDGNPPLDVTRVPVGMVRQPILLLHARDDARVSVQQSQSFASQLHWIGRPVELRLVPSGGHGLGNAQQQAELWVQVESYLRRVANVGG